MPALRKPGHGPALTICLAYAALGLLWIFGSDRLLLVLIEDTELVARLQTAKGWFYVLVTAGLLYLVIRFTINTTRLEEQARRPRAPDSDLLPVAGDYWVPVGILTGLAGGLAALGYLFYHQVSSTPTPPPEADIRHLARWSFTTGLLLVVAAGTGIILWWRGHVHGLEARRLRTELMAQADLAARERAYETLAENSPDIIVRLDRDLRHLYVNRALEAFTGIPREHYLGRTHEEVGFRGKLLATWERHLNQALESGEPGTMTFSHPDREGRVRHFEALIVPETDDTGNIAHVLCISHDVTGHVQAREEISRLRDLYAALSQANQVIIRIDDPKELFQRTCEVVVRYGRLDMAWIGLVDQASGRVTPVSRAGRDMGYLDEIRISTDPARPESRGPVGRAIRQRRASVFDRFLDHPDAGPWQAAAARRGFRSVAAFPLFQSDDCIGALAVYSSEERFFSADIIQLMAEMTGDLSFALDNIEREQARKAAEEQMRLAEEVFEHSTEAIIITDARQRIMRVNRAFTERTGYVPDEVLGRRPHMLRSPHHTQQFYRRILARLRRHGFWEGEIWNRRKGGENAPLWLTLSVVRDEAGRITHYIAVGLDLTETKDREAHIRYLAQHDPVTGLPNRGLLADRLGQALRRAQDQHYRLALLSLDLDRFKIINETLGHVAGDEVLQTVAQRLQDHVNGAGTVSRIGSDQFLILLPEIHKPTEAAQAAERLMACVAEPLDLSGQELTPSSVVGIALYPEDGDNLETLHSHADAAMSMAKQASGHEGYRFFSSDMTSRARERLSLESRLRRALDRGEFRLHYQPQVSLADGTLTGMEALLRWHAGDEGDISPARFIPIAEETGLIVPLGRWVLGEACRQNRAWRQAGLPALPVSVNLSVVQLRRSDVVADVRRALETSGLPGDGLHLEVTESLFLSEDDPAVVTGFQTLREMGISLAIDDFGTGYSNLGYLKRLPIAKLKIDQSFVRGIGDSGHDTAINQAIISIARSLGLGVIAEGVETAAELRVLQALGCDEIQGFYYSRPLDAERAGQLMAAPPPLHHGA
ncbi:EAL and GGDEF domain-containing protein [Alkalilimnicola ehrlichii MLHE-1]|uniref:Diguanylate cyclase/phosphodiesterase with PAS/PAC and GAF sensor(S) n=1 Tax=Alkalilimnicola ehrlichii (strain ATCC BAA-1101 / DSM 17681 / MLHE-1) TaxID=187272 RepID=Q0AAW8_ALKEH|nr:EAL domain-containing protein [Alkalilimnicola ehrlichii]ABI56019.1 diguanylate cyclase/phosphodiesterase with PAS/PAC and GAF sensor(s) [Alkalilimnicola ehrlichii MLHE-1]